MAIQSRQLGVCVDRALLTDELTAASRRYARLVDDLSQEMGTLPLVAYELRKAAIEKARERAEEAREALLRHRGEHKC